MTDALDALVHRIDALFPHAQVSDVLEREVKILDVDAPALRDRVRALRIPRVFSGRVESWKLSLGDAPDGASAKYRLLQRFPPVLIVKGPRIPHPRCKVRREVTWELDLDMSPQNLAKILQGKLEGSSEKRREAFTKESGPHPYHLVIDERSGKHAYAEIEATSDMAIDAALEELGLLHHPLSDASELELED